MSQMIKITSLIDAHISYYTFDVRTRKLFFTNAMENTWLDIPIVWLKK